MSIRFFEGFETVGTELGLANQAITRPRIELRWDDTDAGAAPVTDSFFLIDDDFGEGYAVNMGIGTIGSTGFLGWDAPAAIQTSPPSASGKEIIVGWRIHIPGPFNVSHIMLQVRGQLSVSYPITLTIELQNSVDCKVTNGFATLGTASNVFIKDTWHYVEARFKIADAPDGYVEICVDGDQVLNLTGVDTNNTASTNDLYDFRFKKWVTTLGSEATDWTGYDDIYIMDTDTGPYSTFLGPVRARSLPPNADTSIEWVNNAGDSTNYDKIDENGASAADYVETDRDGYRDIYELTDTSPSYSDPVYAMKAEAEAINTTGGTPTLTFQVISGAFIDSQIVTVDDTVNYSVISATSDTDPATGSQWIAAGVDSAELGILFDNGY